MKITASIVTYNSSDEISNVLDSLIECNISNLEITVVDNNSSDNTCDIVEKKYNFVNLIRLHDNVGFGAGHNVAIKKIDSDYHIIINPDITVKPGQIEKMIEYMEKNHDTVILTPKVLNPDGTEQFLPKKIPSYKYLISGKLENRFKLFYKWRSEYTLRNVDVKDSIEIDFCTGCFMFCRTSTLLTVGGFDERYFLHFEDADLTREMKKYGKTIYNPNVYVIHKWHRDNHKSKKIRKIALQSMKKYFKKWRKKNV